MKTFYSTLFARTFALAIAAACATSGQAIDGRDSIKVSAAQMQSLGIQTVTLRDPATGSKTSYPARVVVPAAAQQVVSAPVRGVITQVLVQPYQAITRATPLLRIASPELGQLQLQLLQAAARGVLTRQTEQRERQLFDEGIIAQRRLQEARAAAREADANLAQARSALRLAGMSPAAIEQVAKSGVAQDTVTLHATDPGMVTEMDIKPGQRVEAATPLIQISRTDKLDIEIQLPSSQAAGWAVGASVEVVDRGVSGRVVGISPAVQASSQTSIVRAAINGKPGNLRPGELIVVNLGAIGSSAMWELPQASVVHNGQQAYVFVRTADGFEARPVTAGNDIGGAVRVQGQFKAGDQLASGGTAALKAAWLAARGSK